MYHQFSSLAEQDGATHSFRIKKIKGKCNTADFGIYIGKYNRVAAFAKNSHAVEAGMQVDDQLVAVNGFTISGPAELLLKCQQEAAVVLSVKRGGVGKRSLAPCQ
tara:strand:+ start:116 stop:430 length:315 start_codon:yes stop_codon:yes gene_type:complete